MADTNHYTIANLGDASGFEALTPSSATSITAALITPTSGFYKDISARAALISVATNSIRYKLYGTVSATEGHPMQAGDTLLLQGALNLKGFNCEDQNGASAVHVTIFH